MKYILILFKGSVKRIELLFSRLNCLGSLRDCITRRTVSVPHRHPTTAVEKNTMMVLSLSCPSGRQRHKIADGEEHHKRTEYRVNNHKVETVHDDWKQKTEGCYDRSHLESAMWGIHGFHVSRS